MSYEIIEKLQREIAGYTDDPAFHQVGMVVEVGDGIARIKGLTKAVSQELLHIQTKSGDVPAIAFSLEEEFIGAIILARGEGVAVGDRVETYAVGNCRLLKQL